MPLLKLCVIYWRHKLHIVRHLGFGEIFNEKTPSFGARVV